MARDASKFHKKSMEKALGRQQSLSMRPSPIRQKSTGLLQQTWKAPPYAQVESQLETQDKDEDDFDSTQLFKSIEEDSVNNLKYNNKGISDLDDIDPTQSQ